MTAPASLRQLAPSMPPQSIADFVCLYEVARIPLSADALLPPIHQGDAYSLLGPTQGKIAFILDETTSFCSTGQAILLLPETTAVIRATTDCILDCITMRGTLTERLFRETAEDGCFFPQAAVLFEMVTKLFSAEDAGIPFDGKAASAAAFSLLMSLHGRASDFGASPYPALITSAISIMREEFAELYGIEELSDRLGVTKNHLIRLFTASVGMSPGKYLTSLRIEYAKLVLRSGESSLEAVAAASGFSGADYFCKVFRKETGTTPRGYSTAHPAIPAIVIDSIYV